MEKKIFGMHKLVGLELFWSGTPTFSSGTPTFCQMGVLNSCFQNPSESSGIIPLGSIQKLEIFHCWYLGVSGYNFNKKYCILLSKDLFLPLQTVYAPLCCISSGFQSSLFAKVLFLGFPNTKG